MFFLKLPFDQLLEVAYYPVLIGYLIVILMKIVGIVEGCGCKLHTERFGQLVERQHIGRVVVAHRATEPDIFYSHILQTQEGTKPLVKAPSRPLSSSFLSLSPSIEIRMPMLGKRWARAMIRSSNHPEVEITIREVCL